jgi:uncharacterized protein (DUF433 family)
MTTSTDMKYIVVDPDILGGRPSIAGHRIGVVHVATWAQQGMTPRQIAEDYGLSLAEVYAALAYYYDHQSDIDRQAAEDDARLAAYAANDQSALAQRIRRELEARLSPTPPAAG